MLCTLAFYRGLPPHLVSIMPMVGIQFGMYKFMKTTMLQRNGGGGGGGGGGDASTMTLKSGVGGSKTDNYQDNEAVIEEATMEVAASQCQGSQPGASILEAFLETEWSKILRRR
jgi:hypothetical protein